MTQPQRWLAAGLIACCHFACAHDPAEHTGTGGQPGDPQKVTRTVAISMSDAMRFAPSSVAVQRNETIRFVVKNDGHLRHEMVLGAVSELKKHAALMIRFPDMQHSDPNQVSVPPGETGELIWRFTQAGSVDFACLQPGHYDAGMKGQIRISQDAR